MTQLEKAARMALEALQHYTYGGSEYRKPAERAITALTQALATTEPVADRCAQCKKAYRQNATSVGCPKCAPGVSVSEDEFQQPIAPDERKGEPVAWMFWTHGPVLVFLNKDEAKLEFERLNHTYPEPARKLIPLYTSPQVPEDVQKDAERYRWLRDKADYMRVPEGSPQVLMTDEFGNPISIYRETYPQGETLDAAIDAARKGE